MLGDTGSAGDTGGAGEEVTVALCQWALLAGWSTRLFCNLYAAHAGRKALEPSGFVGTFVTIVWMAAAFALTWRAGAWSTLIGTP